MRELRLKHHQRHQDHDKINAGRRPKRRSVFVNVLPSQTVSLMVLAFSLLFRSEVKPDNQNLHSLWLQRRSRELISHGLISTRISVIFL